MPHLLMKDVRLVAPFLWLIVPAHMLMGAQSFLLPEFDFWWNLAAALTWTVAVVSIEWHFDADRLLASLPVTRPTVVRARYASALAGVALGAVLYVAYGHGVMAIAGERLIGRWHGVPAWASADGVCAFLAVGYVLVIGFMPFYFRFGLPFGATLFVVSAGITVSAATGLARVGDSTARLVRAQGGAAMGLQPSEIIRGWFSSLAASWGEGPAALALFVGAAMLGFLSVWLSARFFRRREL